MRSTSQDVSKHVFASFLSMETWTPDGGPIRSPTRAAGPGKKFSTPTKENEDFPGLGGSHSGHPGPDPEGIPGPEPHLQTPNPRI